MPQYDITEVSYYVEKKAKKINLTIFLKLTSGHRLKLRDSASEKEIRSHIVYPLQIITDKLDLSKPTEETLQLKYGDYSLKY